MRCWRHLNPRDAGDVQIMMRRVKDKTKSGKVVALLLKILGGSELLYEENYEPKEDDTFTIFPDGEKLLCKR